MSYAPTPEAAELDDLLYLDRQARSMRSWCDEPTRWLARTSATAARAAIAERGTATVVDFGSGTGAAVHALADELTPDERRVTRLVVVDLPGPWFDDHAAARLEDQWPLVEPAVLRVDGRILLLDELCHDADVVMSSMVFHLIPATALAAAVGGIARSLRRGGTLVWTAPDIAPALPGTVLFHHTNRLLRQRVVEAIESGVLAARHGPGVAHAPTPDTVARAARQVLPHPRRLAELDRAIAVELEASSQQTTTTIALDDLVRSALLTPNLALAAEVDASLRRTVVTDLMRGTVLTELDADHEVGLTWAIGTGVRRVEGTKPPDAALLRVADTTATL